ncbi:MAG: PLP-dependent aminotransferase family protein [Proteobacteria bacterium]|nr:PLP-dependent aminotransferase family protein [Pseudomonadota bacterium]
MFFPDPPDVTGYNFDQGLPGRETFPREDLLRLAGKVLARDGSVCLDYFEPQVGYEELLFGNRALRAAIAARIGHIQGKAVSPEGVILTSGSVQGIALAAHGYLDTGDVVAVEATTFPYALKYFQSAGAELRALPIDDDGMDVAALQKLIVELAGQHRRLKMVYLGPTFQCPTGTELAVARRVRLVQLAQQHGFLILEDDVYSELRFEGASLPTLLSMDDSGLVLQAGTFSKMVAPGLRLGWMAGDPAGIASLASVREDLGVSQWIARTMIEYLGEGLLDPHLKKVNAIYRAKRDAAIAGLASVRDDLVKFRTPRGSFYLWIEIDDRVDWQRVAAEAAKARIYFRPGERFTLEADPRQYFRMSYSQAPLETVREGSERLGQIIRSSVRRT